MADPVAWTFPAAGDYSEEMSWLTDVMQASATGVTQHRRLRQVPRTVLSFDSQASDDDRRWLETLLRANAAGTWRVPIAADESRLLSAASADMLMLETIGMRIAIGDMLLIVGDDPRQFETAVIDAFDGYSIMLSSALSNSWPPGTRVFPVRTGKLLNPPVFGRFTAACTNIIPLQFRLDEPLDFDGSITKTYRGLPVFDFPPVWTSDPLWSPEHLTMSVDYEISASIVADPAAMAFEKLTLQYAPATRAEIAEFRSALFSLAGRWGPAWLPSWAEDFRLVSAVADGAAALDVAGPLLSAYPLESNHRDIRIELYDGTVLHRRITAATDLGGDIERLSLDSAIPTGFQVSQAKLISFLNLCAQDADVNLLRYYTSDALQCEITWRGLAHEL